MQIGGANISFGGLASGLDTGAIISALLGVERIPILRLEQKKSGLGAQDKFFGDLKSKLDELAEVARSLSDLDDVSTVRAVSSDEDVLTATTSGGAVPATYEITVTQLAEREAYTSTNGFATRNQTIFSGPASYSFDVVVGTDTYQVDLAGDATLEDVRDAINASGAPVNATIINTNTGANPYQLVLTAADTGTDGAFTLDFGGSPAGLDTALSLAQSNAAQNAQFTVNGLAAASQSNVVSDVIDGVTFTLKTDDDGAGGSPTVTLELVPDGASLKERVNDFIKKYNAVTDFLKGQDALDAEGKAKTDLFGDSTLRSVKSRLREVVGSQVAGITGSLSSLSQIGIKTDSSGHLKLDEEAFDEAVAADEASVAAIFTTDVNGIGDRLDSTIKEFTNSANGIIKTRRAGITSRTKSIDNRISSLNRRLEAYEERLVQKFAAFEQVMANFQAQQASLGF